MSNPDDVRRYRTNWQEEIDSAARYRAMAEAEPREGVAQVYKDLAGMEEKHGRGNFCSGWLRPA
jgi:rubrerythrin